MTAVVSLQGDVSKSESSPGIPKPAVAITARAQAATSVRFRHRRWLCSAGPRCPNACRMSTPQQELYYCMSLVVANSPYKYGACVPSCGSLTMRVDPTPHKRSMEPPSFSSTVRMVAGVVIMVPDCSRLLLLLCIVVSCRCVVYGSVPPSTRRRCCLLVVVHRSVRRPCPETSS